MEAKTEKEAKMGDVSEIGGEVVCEEERERESERKGERAREREKERERERERESCKCTRKL
jgi:hypothetical protein